MMSEITNSEMYEGPPRILRCEYLQGVAYTKLCPSCKGHVEVKVFLCYVHQECTLAKKLPGLACCASCPDKQPSTKVAPMV